MFTANTKAAFSRLHKGGAAFAPSPSPLWCLVESQDICVETQDMCYVENYDMGSSLGDRLANNKHHFGARTYLGIITNYRGIILDL